MISTNTHILSRIYEMDPTYRILYRQLLRKLEYKDRDHMRWNETTGHYQYKVRDMVVIDCYRNKKGKVHGEYKTFTTEGTLIMSCSYRDGVLHGIKEEYHVFTHPPQRKSVSLYENGIILSATHFFDNGHIFRIVHYKEGKRHGPYIMYHKDGRVREQGEYNQNKKIK